MKFNGYELEYDPDECTEPRPVKSVGVVETYRSVQFFDWGTTLPGAQVSLSWDFMSAAEFYALDAIYAQAGAVLWESGMNGKQYNVIITEFSGALINASDMLPYREKVSMELRIIEEVK